MLHLCHICVADVLHVGYIAVASAIVRRSGCVEL